MKKEKCLLIALMLVFGAILTSIPVPTVKASSETVIKVREFNIPGVDPGTPVFVNIDVVFPSDWDLTPQGVIGWSCIIRVDPSVLEPVTLHGAMSGYYLYDFIVWNGFWGHEPELLYVKETWGFSDVVEFLMSWSELVKGAGGPSGLGWYGDPFGLLRMQFGSLSKDAYTLIDIDEAYYYTADGRKEPFGEIIDGHYNAPPALEFPIGLTLEILFIPVILYILWRSKPRKRVLP